MFGLFRRRERRARRTLAAARCTIEALESRKLFDVTTFSANDPNDPPQFYGVDNNMDALNTWTHSWHLTQINVPPHTHAGLSLQSATESQAFYENGGTTYSDTPTDSGPAWIRVYCNGNMVQDWETDDASSQDAQQWMNNPDGWLGSTGPDGGDSTVVWDVETSDNIYLNVSGGSAWAGTYAGFANDTPATRGYDGSVQISLDGPCSQGLDVYFDMPDNVVLNLGGGVADLSLPTCPQSGQQPYATLTGPNTISYDAPITAIKYDRYKIQFAAGQSQQTITYHMVYPYFATPEYDNGLSFSIDGYTENLTDIPVMGGFTDLAGVNWQGTYVPVARTFTISPDVQGELQPGQIDLFASAMYNSGFPGGGGGVLMGNLVANLEKGISFASGGALSQANHDQILRDLIQVGNHLDLDNLTVDQWYGKLNPVIMAIQSRNPPAMLPSNAAGSLWQWASLGKLDVYLTPGQSEEIGLSKVLSDCYGLLDFWWYNSSSLKLDLGQMFTPAAPSVVPAYEVIVSTPMGATITVPGMNIPLGTTDYKLTGAQLSNGLFIKLDSHTAFASMSLSVQIIPLMWAGTTLTPNPAFRTMSFSTDLSSDLTTPLQ